MSGIIFNIENYSGFSYPSLAGLLVQTTSSSTCSCYAGASGLSVTANGVAFALASVRDTTTSFTGNISGYSNYIQQGFTVCRAPIELDKKDVVSGNTLTTANMTMSTTTTIARMGIQFYLY